MRADINTGIGDGGSGRCNPDYSGACIPIVTLPVCLTRTEQVMVARGRIIASGLLGIQPSQLLRIEPLPGTKSTAQPLTVPKFAWLPGCTANGRWLITTRWNDRQTELSLTTYNPTTDVRRVLAQKLKLTSLAADNPVTD